MDILIYDAATGEETVRPMTPDEAAQRATDEAAAAEEMAQRVAEAETAEAARLSARARLEAQGFSAAEIDVMYPNLSEPITPPA